MFIAGTYFLTKFYQEKPFELSKSMWTLLILIGLCWISVVMNLDLIAKPVKQIFRTKYMVISFLSIFAFYYFFTKQNYKKLSLPFRIFIIATSIASINGALSIFLKYSILRFRPHPHHKSGGMYGMPMSYGYSISLSMILMFSYYLLRKQNEQSKKYLIAFILLNGIGMYFAYARGGNIGFAVGFLFLLLLRFEKYFKENKKKFYLGLSSLVLATIIVCLNINWKPILQKFMGSRTNAVRVGMLQGAYYAVLEKPVFGLGFRNFEKYSVEIKRKNLVKYFPDWGGHAHNNIAEMFTGIGVVGGSIFLAWMIFWLVEMYRGPPVLRVFIPFIICFFISGLFQSTIIDGECAFLIFFVYAFSQSILQKEKQNPRLS
jgi:O-antigen ligase